MDDVKEERTKIIRRHHDKFFLYRRGKEDNKNLDRVTKKLKRFCGYQTQIEKEDEEIHNIVMKNLSNLQI